MWRCDICSETCETISQFQEHRMSHPKPLKCPRCRKKFALLSQLRRHGLQAHKFEIKTFDSFDCSYCGQKFTIKRHLRRHMLGKHFKPVLPSKPTYMCDICGHNFNSINILDSHRFLHTVKPTAYVPIKR